MYKKGICLNKPKSHYRFFRLIAFSGGELPVDKKCGFVHLSVHVKHPCLRVNGCHLLYSIPFVAFHFAFISFHVPFLNSSPFISFLSFCFHVLACSVAMYQSYRSSKADMLKPSQTGQVGTRTNAHIFFIRYRFGYRLATIWRPVQVAIFSLLFCWASNALAVLKCKLS